MEWELQQAGFDYTYDKRLYDRLVARRRDAGARAPAAPTPTFQDHSLRFLENHDEPRAAATFPPPMHKAAAVVDAAGARAASSSTRVSWRGAACTSRCTSGAGPAEPVDDELRAFYDRLLDCLPRPELHDGEWRLASCRQAWDGNPTTRSSSCRPGKRASGGC